MLSRIPPLVRARFRVVVRPQVALRQIFALVAILAIGRALPEVSAAAGTEAVRRVPDAAVGEPSAGALTRVADIRHGGLGIKGRPVRIEGVVTYYDRAWSLLFVQDATEGIFIYLREGTPLDVAVGDRVRVQGVGGYGDFAPVVEQPVVTRLGGRARLEPARPDFQELVSGAWDSQYIEIDGMVRGIHPLKADHLLFDVAVGDWRVLAQLPDSWTGPLPEHLVDSRVRIRGVAGTLFTPQRQLVGLQLFIPSLDDIRVLEPPVAGPFASAVQPIGTLYRWVTTHGVAHRVRVNGEVTWVQGRQIYVRDPSGNIGVTLWGNPPVKPGEHVDVSGFIAPGVYSPVLEDAMIRRTDPIARPAVPVHVTAAELMSGKYDGGLVSVDAEVTDQVSATDERLGLKSGGVLFTAMLPDTNQRLAPVDPGALVSVTGVCRVQVNTTDSPRVPRGIQVLLRDPGDVRVVRTPPWSRRRTLQAVGVLAVAALAAFGWVLVLRRRVARQSGDLIEQVDRGRALEARYRELFDTANDLVITCDADWRITSINRAGERVIGLTREAAIGRSLRDVVAPEAHEQLDRLLGPAAAAAQGVTLEVEFVRADGARTMVELDAHPIHDRGRHAGLQAIGRDVTARTRAKAELARARDTAEAANRAKSEFVANISHEVRTPLNGIIGMTELVLGTSLDDEQRQYLGLMRSSADSLLHVINDILDFSKIEAGHLGLETAPFELAARLTATLEPLGVTARVKGLAFDVSIGDALPAVVTGDAARFAQVLTNLVGNAIKFTIDGGVFVHVDVAPPQPGDPAATVRIRATVRDTGIGIPAEKHTLVFQAFTQADGSTSRRFGGTGLGLAIAGSLVKRMGGQITLSSAPGEGSTFVVVVPFVRSSGAELPAMTPGDGLSRLLGPAASVTRTGTGAARVVRPLDVLLVEDNPINQRLAIEILRRRGHTVVLAENGREAVRRHAAQRFDIILMDVQMPEMNGLDATRAIRAAEAGTGAHLPIVAMTAHAMAGDRERCLEAGMDEYLTKPIRAEALITHVERMAGAHAGPAGVDAAAPADLSEALARVDDDRALLAEIAALFLEDADAMLAEVAAAVAAADGEALARTAHRLKGSVLTFSAGPAAAAALELEQIGREGDLARAPMALARLTASIVALRGSLASLVDERKTA